MRLLPEMTIILHLQLSLHQPLKCCSLCMDGTVEYRNPITSKNATTVPIPNVPVVINVPIW